jgi:hypothetical protein
LSTGAEIPSSAKSVDDIKLPVAWVF